MKQPLVSIIIPLYNAEIFITETIQSALAQTWQNIEVIIVDDGSTDGSLTIAKKYSADNVKIYTQQNKGASTARNYGLKKAKGEYIQFLDADDLLSPDKIAKQIESLYQNPDKLAICSTIHFQDKILSDHLTPSLYEEAFLYNDDNPARFLINLLGGFTGNGSMITIHSWLTPVSVIHKAGWWNEDLTLDDDGEFFCRVILNSNGIIKTDGVYNYYRKHENTNTLSGKRNLKDLNSLLQSALSKQKELLSRNNSKEARYAIYRQLYDVFMLSYPLYPIIYKTALNALPENVIAYKPVFGRKIINWFAAIFGIKLTLYLRHAVNKNKI